MSDAEAEDVLAVDGAEGTGLVPSEDDEARELTIDDRFRYAVQDFQDAVEALRETHSELSPAASNLDDVRTIWKDSIRKSRRLTREELAVFAPVFKDVPASGMSKGEFVDRVFDAVIEETWGPNFALAFMRRIYRPDREPIFHNAMLISAVAALEAQLGLLTQLYYRAAPAALHDLPRESAKEFSLQELQELGSIEEAIERAIESRTTRLMYGSLADWRKFFKDRMNLDMAELTDDWRSILEVFERRHCVVHHGAKASRRYVANFSDANLYESLDADAAYVSAALERLEHLGLLLSFSVWRKFALDDQALIDAVESIAFEALKEERWAFCRPLYEWWLTLPLSEYEQRQARVNVFLTRKGVEGLDSVRAEIEDWDVTGSDEIFRFAQHCLLEDLDAAFAELPELVERDRIGGEALATWPLLSPLRADDRIKAYDELMRDYVSDEGDQAGAEALPAITRTQRRSPSPPHVRLADEMDGDA